AGSAAAPPPRRPDPCAAPARPRRGQGAGGGERAVLARLRRCRRGRAAGDAGAGQRVDLHLSLAVAAGGAGVRHRRGRGNAARAAGAGAGMGLALGGLAEAALHAGSAAGRGDGAADVALEPRRHARVSPHPLAQLPRLLPGVALAALLGGAAWWVAERGLPQWGLSALTVAIGLGMLLGNLAHARLPTTLVPGIHAAQRTLLRAGVVLYGLRLSFQDVAAIGPSGLMVDVVIVGGTLLLGVAAGQRLFRLDRHTALLTAAGSAICGAAAVLAVERILRADPAKVAVAVASVVLFGTLDIFLYPALFPYLGLDRAAFGLFTGATVHEVAQVVAVGSAIAPEVADSAVVVKLTRVLLLVP